MKNTPNSALFVSFAAISFLMLAACSDGDAPDCVSDASAKAEQSFTTESSEIIPVWDGISQSPLTEISSNVFYISSPEQLAYLAQDVNSGTSDYEDCIIFLNSDIDLDDQLWTPIGNSDNSFKGTFDGNNHVIKNLNVHGDDNNLMAGLFGKTDEGSIFNLEIHNAHISNVSSLKEACSGTIAANPSTTEFRNITIKGEVQIEAPQRVGGAFGSNVQGNIIGVNIDANNDSYVHATNNDCSSDSDINCAGGIIGNTASGEVLLSGLHSNIDVVSYAPGVGGIVGATSAGTSVNNCTSSGDVTLYTDASNDSICSLAIGGIIGTHTGETDCSGLNFTGHLFSHNSHSKISIPEINKIGGIKFGGSKEGLQNDYDDIKVDGDSVSASAEK